MARELKLGLNTGYWGAGPPAGVEDAIAEAERLGFDSMWTAEAYGSDVLTPLAWWGARTERLRLGTAIVQMSARTPAATAMAAHDHGPPLRRALHPRPRRVRPAGRRGLVRPAVRQAARPHARVHRDPARRLRARGPRHRARPALPAPVSGRHGPRQAAEVDAAPACARRSRSSSAPRAPRTWRCAASCATAGWRSSSRRATRASTATRWPRASRARARGARSTTSRSAPRCPSSSTTTSRPRPTCCARCTPCTSAAWARAARTSTTTSPCASATRPRPSAARTSTSRAARTRPPPRCRRRLVEELALIGPRDKIRHDLEAWRESIVTTLLVAGSPEMLRDAAELVLG